MHLPVPASPIGPVWRQGYQVGDLQVMMNTSFLHLALLCVLVWDPATLSGLWFSLWTSLVPYEDEVSCTFGSALSMLVSVSVSLCVSDGGTNVI